MNPEESRALAQFCADQYYAFDPRAWQRRSRYDHHASSMAAMVLSMTDWYGHEDELERIAAEAGDTSGASEAFRRAEQDRFDADQFSAMVRSEIAQRRSAAPVAMRPSHEYRSAA
jgi:hypothetical protein